MRWKSLLVWALIAAAVLIALGVHDALRAVSGQDGNHIYIESIPSWLLLLFGAPALFIAHHLAAAADADRRAVATYPRYFDIGWTSAAQVAMGLALVGALWAVLMLGSALFGTIGINFPRDLISKPWVAWPATCVTFATAIQITDDRTVLVRGGRMLALTLLSWLMPVMTFFVAMFLLTLPFTGLEPLWQTRTATPILLTAAAAIVALINAAYQDGDAERARSRVLVVSGLVARATVAPLVAIAGYSTWLRIAQYGLTPDRVAAVAATLIAAVYAIGYLASLFPPLKLKTLLERTNIAAACTGIGVFLCIFSPVADPARISVDDQVSRLLNGKTAPEEFDFRFLRWNAAQYGRDALAKLAAMTEGKDAEKISKYAQAEQKSLDPYGSSPGLITADRIHVWPEGRKLPGDFPMEDPGGVQGRYPLCFGDRDSICDAILLDLDKDGAEEVLVVESGRPSFRGPPPSFWRPSYIEVFQMRGGVWQGTETYAPLCPADLDLLRRGEVTTAPRQGYDLVINGRRVDRQTGGGPYLDCR
jgi:hypothetical protein